MDETQQSRASDAAAAATRKRRSSILKSQRPPRTPFSELEFHVATPTDTSKSRRVSFSRRTGVAEFITNEATTTWKNFYEEHNKSLESSGNDSGAHAPKPAIGHLGKRLFDQQFQEVEAIDFMASIDNLSTRNINTSMNKVNFTEQLASLECTTGEKYLLNPQANLEMSAFTDCKSNVFGEDFALPTMGETSGRIDVNFSAVQAIGSSEVKDDLDQIQEDLQNAKSNVVCPGPFNDRRDLSEYIEVDFNSTHVVMRNDESDMSITDTIHSPKVQDVSKSNSFKIDKKSVLNKDWVADKENIAVFEGCMSSVKSATEKRKTIVYENDTGNISITQALPVNIILPVSKTSEKRKTIVYDSDVADISVTQAVPVNIMIVNKDTEKRKTIIYENDTGNISVTQAIPSNIILPDKNKTIISQDSLGNISITKGIPIVKIISSNVSQVSHKSIITDDLISNVSSVDNNDKHKTIFYGNESMEISGFDNNMSITKPIDTKHLLGGTYKKTQENLVSEIKNENHNISTLTRPDVFVYQASATYNDKTTKDGSLPSNLLNEDISNCEAKDSVTTTDSERKESCVKVDINTCKSQTQWLKQEIFDLSDKSVDSKVTGSKKIVKEENMHVLKDSLSPKNPETNKRMTIVYDNDMGNISITQAIPANIIYPSENKPSEKRITIDCDADALDISVTQAVPVGVLLVNKDSEIPKSIIYDNEEDISVTQAIPTNIILTDNEIMESDHEMNDISFTQVITAAKIISSNSSEVKNNTIVIDNQNAEITLDRHDKVVNKNVARPDASNISLTKPIDNIPLYSGALQKSMINELLNRSNTIKNDTNQSMTTKSNTQDLFVYQAEMAHDGLVTKDSSEHIQKVNSDDVSLLRKNTDESKISLTKPIDNIPLYSEALQKSMINELLNKSHTIKNDTNQNMTAKSNTQDLLVYQAEMAHDGLVTKDSSEHIQKVNSDDVSLLRKNTDESNISLTKPIDNIPLYSGALQKSMINELLNKSHTIKNDTNQNMTTKSNTQDLLVYQAEMAHDGLVTKDSSVHIQKVNSDDVSLLRKNTDESNISLTKPIDNIPLYSGALQKSMINELLNRSNTIKNYMNQSMNTKSNTQDLFVYQAEMAHDGLVTKDSSEQVVNSDDFSLLRKNRSVSSAKTESNESYVEMNRSLQMSRLRLLTLESEEQPEKLITEQENNQNNALSGPNIAQLNTTDTKLVENTFKAVLDDLLDMSQSHLDAIVDKNDATVAKPEEDREITDAMENKSNDSTIHSRKENNDEAQTDRFEDMVIKDNSMLEHSQTPLALEYKQEQKSKMSFDVLKQMLKTKLNDIQNISAKHRQREKDRKSDIEHDKSIDESKSTVEDNSDSSKSKKFKDANDTNELLEMLSDLTDKSRSSDVEEPKESVSRRTSQHSEANEPRRLSVAPNRLSIVLSREDLLNNISMAHAALQKSMEIDESIADTSITSTEEHSPPKTARASSEVVKKLQFEDESANETNVKSDIKSSPLKKTAFEDIPEMTDHKSKVIPGYLKDVSDDVKALMDDLVKPNADAMPFQPIGKVQNMQTNPSTSSMQIQANLITSSQIAVNDDDSNSESTSSYNLGNLSSPSLYTDTKSLKSSLKSSKIEKPENLKETVICPKFAPPSHTVSDRVIIFDQNNPLNNVLLVPPDYADAHRYRPGLSVITAKESESDVLEKVSLNNTEEFDVKSTKYNVNSVLLSRPMEKHCITDKLETSSTSTSLQESVRVRELKDTKVNTVIAMKQNEELLETSSSLTLVDDAVTANNFNVHLYTESENNKNTSSSGSLTKSPEKLYENDEEDSYIPKTNSSDFTSTDEKNEFQMANKPKKRNYSPFKRYNIIHGWSSLDNTPKQISKMQKLSTSPYLPETEKLKAEKDDAIDNAKMEVNTSFNTKDLTEVKQKKESPRKSKRGADITVQQLITEYDFEGNIDQEALSKHIIKVLSRSGSSSIPTGSVTDFEIKSLGIASSFTSSKNQMEMRDACSVTTTDTKSSARSNRLEWQPESKESVITSVSECDSSVNVVAKIDMLPFMGSHECEWEPSSSDMWAFRLLHARVRLTARLAHRHDNATRTRVRADTRVLSVALHVAHTGGDIKNSVATLCVKFAADTMRQYIGRGCSRAGEVPALLRRCAAAARVALRWGRAMHEARLHLAYTLRQDKLALKVANIALRSVWEVTMRLELVTEPNSMPWPRACDVKVTRVVSDVTVTDDEVEKLLSSVPSDWGHAPRVIWKIFSYLKNKTRGDELLGLS